MTTRTAPTARTTNGVLAGRWDDDVASFLGVPYAQPPIGARRWASPVPAAAWDGERAADAAGPIAPQIPSRLEAVMGPMQAPRPDEDCLSLNVWTRAPEAGERLPVLVFLHGGGYLSGAGSAAWYDGRALAAHGAAVVVTINYRLGALGYLYLPATVTGDEQPIANLGLQDQRLALEWVAENVAAFGGDPENVTVCGQSGGAHSILGLRAMADGAAGLFRRAILQSAPFGMPAATPERAEIVTARFMEATGVTGGGLDALRALPVETILRAQMETLMRSAVFGGVEPPFHLVVDGEALPEEPVAAGMNGSLDGLDVLLGFTRDEGTPFYCADDALWGMPAEPMVGRVAAMRGEQVAQRLQAYLQRSPDAPPAAALAEMVSDEFLIGPTVALAERLAERGKPAHLFRFSWGSDAMGGRLGACHTIELPFVFGNPADWTEAPMLGSATAEQLAPLADAVQDAWLAFAAGGDPNHPGLPQWEPFAPGGATMDLDLTSEIVADPSDGRRELWG